MPGKWTAVRKWAASFSNVLAAASTPVLAGATLYLACSARDSADSAREAAEAATKTVEVASVIVGTVKDTADAAKASVDVTREWFELSQRPFVNLSGWRIIRINNSMVIRGTLNDIANVPTHIETVCVWAGLQQTVDSQKTYHKIELAENAIAFMDHHQWIQYPPLQWRNLEDGQAAGFLSTMYTISREGTRRKEHWRVESEIHAGKPAEFTIGTIDMYRVEETIC